MLIARELKQKKGDRLIKYAGAHRHVRSQGLLNPAFTAHFGIFCLATGGPDTGSFSFELEQLLDHLNVHLSVFANEFDLGGRIRSLRSCLKQ